MPGLAVAEALRDRGWSVSWLGTRMGMERQLIEPRGIAFDAIDFSGLRGKGVKTLLLGGFYLLRALWQSRALIRARKPRVMFSTGGYVAVPAGMAASTLGVPLVLLNSDAAPLMSTKMLKPLSSAVLCGFDGAAAKMAGKTGRRDRKPCARRNSADRSTRAALCGPFRSVATTGYRRQPGCSGAERKRTARTGAGLIRSARKGGSSMRRQTHRFCPRALSRGRCRCRNRRVYQRHARAVRSGRRRRLSRRCDHGFGACCSRSGKRAGSACCVDDFTPAR